MNVRTFVLFTKRYLPARGGIEIIVRQTAQLLKPFGRPVIVTLLFDDRHRTTFSGMYPLAPAGAPYRDDDGTEVIPLSPTPLQRFLMLPMVALDVKRIANSGTGALRPAFYRFVRMALRRKFSRLCSGAVAVHAFEGSYYGCLARETAAAAGMPFIISPFVHPGSWGDDVMNVGLYRRADMVLTLSEYEKEWFRSIGIPDCRMIATGTYPLPQPPLSLKKTFGISGRVVLFRGRREIYKGYRLLLDAWEKLRPSNPDAWVVLAGPGFDRSVDPERRVCTSGPTDCVPTDFDIFCMPSESETFGLVYVEAWEQGKPVVARSIPAVVELMHGEPAGLLVDRPDAAELARHLATLLKDPQLCERMGACGRRIQQEYYSRERFEENCRKAYRAVQAGL